MTSSASTGRSTRATTSPTSTGCARRARAATRSSTWPPRSGWGSTSATSTTTSGTTTSAPRSCSGPPRRPAIRRLVFASSMVVYGEGAYACPRPRSGAAAPAGRRGPGRAAGSSRPARVWPRPGRRAWSPSPPPLDPRNVYAATKAHGEHLGAVWARETGGVVRRAALPQRLRTGHAPGHPVRGRRRAVRSAAWRRGEPPQVFEDGRQRRNFVHVDDVARAVVAAVTADLPAGLTPLNIGSPLGHHRRRDGRAAHRGARRTRAGDHRPLPARRRPPHHRRLPGRGEPARLARRDPAG